MRIIDKDLWKYIVEGKSSIAVIEVTFNNETYFVDPNMLFKSSAPLLNKDDSQYELFVNKIKAGGKVKNYKTSKYFQMYMKRAKVDHPEFFFQD